jgi:hypothetical protein
MELTNTKFKYLINLSFIVSAIIFLSIAYNSFGYDDEYWNIRMIEENSLKVLVSKIQSFDVHPPLSYILNFSFYKLFNNWTAVRLISSLLFILSLGYTLFKTKNNEAKIILLLLVGFNPTIMLWVTSIRWYAYAVPILMILSHPLENNSKYYWYYFFIGFLLLSFISYVGIILIIPYFIWYFIRNENSFTSKVKKIIAPAAIYIMAYAYQLYIFYTIHRLNNIKTNEQTFDTITSVKSYASSVLGNQAIFPTSIIGFFSITGYLIVFIVLTFLLIKNKETYKIYIVFVIGSILYIITGIAGKLRNLVLLDIAKSHLITNGIHSKFKKVLYIGLVFILLANIKGIYNVWNHQKTTKNAWNLPLNKSIQLMNTLEDTSSKEVYFTFHPTYTYYLTKSNKNLISFYSSLYFDSSKIKTCVQLLSNDSSVRKLNFNFILTYKGRSINDDHYSEMISQMKALKSDSIIIYKLGFDGDYKLKQKIYLDYPEYTFYLYKYYGIKSKFIGLKIWEKNKL